MTPGTIDPSAADVAQWAQKLSDAMSESSRHFGNEMELREHVHPVIKDAISSLYNMGISSSSGEMNTASTGGNRRFLDRLYGGVVVEWEWNMNPSRMEHGAQQALEYLSNIRHKQPGRRSP